ncbi:chaplin family protein [Streptomyces sp. NBC_00829]|uniref:chaplin n=1 Tax=Streptomyces sp. NBC_00829 TaxID=2903679 RepID=UPI00386CD8F9
MRQVTRKGLITMAAAGGVIALGGSYAQADSGAHSVASNSPGVASGNSIQAPVDIPVNVCGNTVNVIGLLNPVAGNKCANGSGNHGSGSHGSGSHAGSHGSGSHGGGSNAGGAHAGGGTSNSPGVASGNHIQAPVHVPVNACGNTVTIGGLGNPALGNQCGNGTDAGMPPGHPGHPGNPGNPDTPGTPGNPGNPGTPGTPGNPGTPQTPVTPDEPNAPGAQSGNSSVGIDELAHTGSGPLGMLAPAGAGLLLAGVVLYRRSRASA